MLLSCNFSFHFLLICLCWGADDFDSVFLVLQALLDDCVEDFPQCGFYFSVIILWQSNIFRRFMKVVTLKVKKSQTIRSFKSILHRKQCDSEKYEDPLLTAGLCENEDQRRLNDQVLQMVDLLSSQQSQQQPIRMTIYVKIPSNKKTLVLGAKGYHIVHDIKSVVQKKEGIQPDHYTLFHEGKQLEAYRTLVSYNVRTESTLHLIFNPRHVLPIFVKTPIGKTLRFELNILYTLQDVKAIVENFVGCPLGDCNVFYEGNQLEDNKALAFYGIEENSTLELQAFWIQILVKIWSGKTITLDVTRSSTIREVKEKISCKIRVPITVQSIVFAGKRLEEDRSLASYDIQKHSTLHMILSPSVLAFRNKVIDSQERS